VWGGRGGGVGKNNSYVFGKMPNPQRGKTNSQGLDWGGNGSGRQTIGVTVNQKLGGEQGEKITEASRRVWKKTETKMAQESCKAGGAGASHREAGGGP